MSHLVVGLVGMVRFGSVLMRFCLWRCWHALMAEERRPVRLDKLAPDLAMLNLSSHKLRNGDLQKEGKPIGEGLSLSLPLAYHRACMLWLREWH